VGDWVEAIGSPFALSQTVTAGIISAKNRTIEKGASGQFQHFIQTDAAINPGNSGGPLLNMNGEVIGVNTAIYTQSAGYQGIGFAMPSNTVVEVYNDLISASHKVTRGSIGIRFNQGLSGAVNRVYGFKNGVLVQQTVQPGGPADKAGLKAGDIITTIDGRQIKDGDDLVNEITSRRPGSTIRLGYLRDGKQGYHGHHRRPGQASSRSRPTSKVKPALTKGDAGETKLGLVVRQESDSTPPSPRSPAWSFSRSARDRSPTCRDWSRASSSPASTSSPPAPKTSSTPWSARSNRRRRGFRGDRPQLVQILFLP
jgi:serine protease Do